ncbi:hypothetical protein KsCSTR_05710 [Candidatus Kuenenia stuttgartiensis]|uniref:Uncharacterized protein n=1 Tax=Kuenenia stuttgartiensis TaxID=174633 RepID=Q1Q004_KUEST|nr:hypothetical protein KsCSTR_05710 [Candidatus Kuenenia stuttgartiensis]TVM01609.1 MAG: hypothetical protein CV080_04030 [Candidatus Kuenenia stuttgartiensis]CAJ72669.1 unknown protein [Candidatus Kuenenia stuttgartiensis]
MPKLKCQVRNQYTLNDTYNKPDINLHLCANAAARISDNRSANGFQQPIDNGNLLIRYFVMVVKVLPKFKCFLVIITATSKSPYERRGSRICAKRSLQ